MNTNTDLAGLSNDSLLVEVKRAAAHEREATVHLIALLGEIDTRRLYLREGCSSLHTYCTQVLHLSDDAAFFRIEAARAVRSYPVILEMLTEGALSPTVVRLLRPHLSTENHLELLEAARYKSKRDVEMLVARVRPQPDVSSSVRKLPPPKSVSSSRGANANVSTAAMLSEPRDTDTPEASIARNAGGTPEPSGVVVSPKPPVVKPLTPERYKVQFTISAGTHAKLRQVQDLLRHQVPNGDPAEVFDRALTLLLDHLQRTKFAAAKRPRLQQSANTRSRHIPASVKREVWRRDGGRCAFVGTEGRCTETGLLEFHHVQPYAAGGEGTTQNIVLRCRAHNGYEAKLLFGPREPMTVREDRAEYVIFEGLGPERVPAWHSIRAGGTATAFRGRRTSGFKTSRGWPRTGAPRFAPQGRLA